MALNIAHKTNKVTIQAYKEAVKFKRSLSDVRDIIKDHRYSFMFEVEVSLEDIKGTHWFTSN